MMKNGKYMQKNMKLLKTLKERNSLQEISSGTRKMHN